MFSPNGAFYLEAASDGTGLYRTSDEQLMSHSPASFDPSLTEIAWAPNSEAAITSDFSRVYLWTIDGTPPQELPLGETHAITWSPEADRFVAVEAQLPTRIVAFVIMQTNGEFVRVGEDAIRDTDIVSEITWLTRNIIEIVSGDGMCCGIGLYFDADAGTQFPSWHVNLDLGQGPINSPDVVWQARDTSHRFWKGEPYASGQYFPHDYAVLNFQTGEEYVLYSGDRQYLEWVGWSADSVTFYLISRPTVADAVASADWPFGLMALDPVTRETRMLFEEAVFAELSPDQARACVAFPARRVDGTLGLDAGVFDLSEQTLAGRQPILDTLAYPRPTWEGESNEWAGPAREACGEW